MKFKLDDVDHKILDLLIDNSRIPFTDIAKKLLISAGTVHVRVKKMEDAGIIKGSSLALDYKKLGYTFIAYIGIFLEKTHLTNIVLDKLNKFLSLHHHLQRKLLNKTSSNIDIKVTLGILSLYIRVEISFDFNLYIFKTANT